MKPTWVGISALLLAVLVTVAATIFISIWFISPYSPGQRISNHCFVNGLGTGQCLFTNTGTTPGTTCVEVSLVNDKKASASSGRICSGRVWPNDTAEKAFTIVLGETCKDEDRPQKEWTEVCRMDITE